MNHDSFPALLTKTELEWLNGNIHVSNVRLAVKRKRLDMNMAYCRKIFATFLRTRGVEQEIIDLLQGRAPKSVFAKHYFKPNFTEEKEKITVCLENLCLEINATS